MSVPLEPYEDFWWQTSVTLPNWAGFLSCLGPYGAQDKNEPSDGTVTIVFAPEERGIAPLEKWEIELVEWVIANQEHASQAALSALLDEYPRLQALYDYSADEAAQLMPDLSDVTQLKDLIGLHHLFVHQILPENCEPYFGYEFGCSWDPEHGLGILMHGLRVVRIGSGETSSLLWMAKEDASKP